MAVTVFKLVLMLRFSLWLFTAVLTVFQLIVLLVERVQSVFFNCDCCQSQLWGTMLFPGLRRTVWLIGLLQRGLFEWHTPFGSERCYHKFYCENSKPTLLFRNIQSINTAHLSATHFWEQLQNYVVYPWAALTNTFIWTIEMTMCNVKMGHY